MKGLQIKTFNGICWDNPRKNELDILNEWIKNHDAQQIILSDFYCGYRGFILYKPDEE